MTSDDLQAKRLEVVNRLLTLTADAENDELSTAKLSAAVAEKTAAKVVLARLDEKIQAALEAERRASAAEKRAAVGAAVALTIPRALVALVELDAALTAIMGALGSDGEPGPGMTQTVGTLVRLRGHVGDTLVDLRRRNVDGIPAARPARPARPAPKVYQRAASSGPLRLTGGRAQSATVDVRGRSPLLI